MTDNDAIRASCAAKDAKDRAARAMLAALNFAATGFAIIANNLSSNSEAARLVALDNFRVCKAAIAQAEAAGIRSEA